MNGGKSVFCKASPVKQMLSTATVLSFILFLFIALMPVSAWAGAELGAPAAYPEETAVGTEITWLTQLNGSTGPVFYTFFLYRDSQLITYAGPSQENYFQYAPLEGGTYRVGVIARDDTGIYSSASAYHKVAYPPLIIKSVTANRDSVPVGYPIRWTVLTSGGSGKKSFGFNLLMDGALLESMTFTGEDNFFTCTPQTKGNYKVQVLATDDTGTASFESTEVPVGAEKAFTGLSISQDKDACHTGETINWIVQASGGSAGLAYFYTLQKDGTDIVSRPYDTSNVFSYTPTEPGIYRLNVIAMSNLDAQTCQSANVTVTSPECVRLKGLWADTSKAEAGETITWTASSEGGAGTVYYTFLLYRDSKLVFTSDPGPSAACSYTALDPGEYRAVVYAKDDACTDVLSSAYLKVVPSKLTILSVTPSSLTGTVGMPITWTVETAGGSGEINYMYAVNTYQKATYGPFELVATSSFTPSNTYTYLPDEENVDIYLEVLASDGHDIASFKCCSLYVATAGNFRLLGIVPDKTAAAVGETITWTVVTDEAGTLPEDGYYWYSVYFDGEYFDGHFGLAPDKSFTITAAKAGSYVLEVMCSKIWPSGGVSPPVTVTGTTLDDFSVFVIPHKLPDSFELHTIPAPTLPPPVVATQAPTLPPPVVATPAPTLPPPVVATPAPTLPPPVVATQAPTLPPPVVATQAPALHPPVVATQAPQLPPPVVATPAPTLNLPVINIPNHSLPGFPH